MMMFKAKALIVLLLLVGQFNAGIAAELPLSDVQLHFKRFSLNEGLPSAYINTLTQTQEGYIWIGSKSGLSRFDGYDFLNFRLTDELEGTGISNDVTAVLPDDNHSLWVGTDSGLHHFDINQQHFTSVPFPAEQDHTVLTLYLDETDRLWVGTDRGLYYLNTNSQPFSLSAQESVRQSIKFLAHSEGKLWIGSKSGLFVKDNRSNDIRTIVLKEAPDFDVRYERIFDAVIDKNRLYLATDGDGLLIVDTTTEKLLSQYLNDQPFIQSNRIWSIKKQGEWLWLGYFYDGLTAWQPHNNEHFHSRYHAQITYSIPFDNISQLFFDKQGLLWVGTTNGLAVGDTGNRHVIHLGEFQGISDKHLWSALFSNNGIWFGSENGLNYYDIKAHMLHTYQGGNKPEQMPRTILWSLADAGTQLYIGSNQGLLRFDKQSTAVSHVGVPDAELEYAPVYTIKRFADDLLVAFDQGGLARWDLGQQKYRRYMANAADEYITSIIEYNDGYVAGSRRGLYQINRDLTKSEPVNLQNTSLSLQQLHITSIAEHQGTLWLATMNQGIIAITYQSESWQLLHHITTEQGLEENQIRALVISDSGELWIATATQIMQLDTHTVQLKHFSHLTHWLNMEYHANAMALSENGSIAFGGNQGILVFNPAHLPAQSFRPPLNLTAYQVMDETYHQSTDHLELKPEQSYMAFTLAALNFLSPESMKYQYRLMPLHQNWQTMSSRQLSLSQLPYDSYVLEIRSAANTSQWNGTVLRLPIDVHPPWWWSPRMRTVYGILAFISLVVGLYYVHRRLLSLRFFARHDSLTKLPNRHYFQQVLKQRLLQACRQQSPLALVYMDLNAFKQANDQYGHQAGDSMLVHFSDTVQQAIRHTDFLSRLGGDEFVLILDQVEQRQAIIQLIERIHQSLQRGIKWQQQHLTVEASFGISLFEPSAPISADELIRQADKAMYNCKQKQLAYCFYDHTGGTKAC
jgi:diguanylate cyclase (GGDEF)-like protein